LKFLELLVVIKVVPRYRTEARNTFKITNLIFVPLQAHSACRCRGMFFAMSLKIVWERFGMFWKFFNFYLTIIVSFNAVPSFFVYG